MAAGDGSGTPAPTVSPLGGSPLAQAVRQQLAAKYPQLDPNAVMAVGSQEGLSGGIGDGGHAFGPFQLNNAGGVITGKFAGWSPQQIQQWATSPGGINYALDGISKVAGGLKGQAAINAIVSQFERPANIPGEIAGASASYGKQPSFLSSSNLVAAPGAVSPAVSPVVAQATAPATGASMQGLQRQALLQTLMSNNQSLAAGQAPSPASLLPILSYLKQAEAAQVPQPAQTAPATPQGRTAAPTSAQPGPAPSNVVEAAHGFLGTPYVYGGNNPKTGLDCSSFVQQAYAKVGVTLPRTTTQQINQGQSVPLHELQPGDVIFTEPGRGPSGGPGHEGLYIGNGQIQQSPHTGTVNSIIGLQDFLGGGFVGARRYT